MTRAVSERQLFEMPRVARLFGCTSRAITEGHWNSSISNMNRSEPYNESAQWHEGSLDEFNFMNKQEFFDGRQFVADPNQASPRDGGISGILALPYQRTKSENKSSVTLGIENPVCEKVQNISIDMIWIGSDARGAKGLGPDARRFCVRVHQYR